MALHKRYTMPLHLQYHMSLCSNQSSLFSFSAQPSSGKPKDTLIQMLFPLTLKETSRENTSWMLKSMIINSARKLLKMAKFGQKITSSNRGHVAKRQLRASKEIKKVLLKKCVILFSDKFLDVCDSTKYFDINNGSFVLKIHKYVV